MAVDIGMARDSAEMAEEHVIMEERRGGK